MPNSLVSKVSLAIKLIFLRKYRLDFFGQGRNQKCLLCEGQFFEKDRIPFTALESWKSKILFIFLQYALIPNFKLGFLHYYWLAFLLQNFKVKPFACVGNFFHLLQWNPDTPGLPESVISPNLPQFSKICFFCSTCSIFSASCESKTFCLRKSICFQSSKILLPLRVESW